MTRNEARQRNRNHPGPATLALLRRRAPLSGALHGNLKRAAWNDDCLLTLIRAAA